MSDWTSGAARVVLAETDSTNAEALRRAAAGSAGPLWVLAHRQTAARARRGRAWAMAPGDFAASLLLYPECPPAEAALRSFVAALALRDALVAVTDRAEMFALKWPNDVLLTERKLAGILLETGSEPNGRMALVVGIGVNLVEAPAPERLEPGAMEPISLHAALGAAPRPEVFLDHLALAFQRWEARLASEGFAPIRSAWLKHAARLGKTILARTPGREIIGRFETIDETGALVLATPQGRVSLPAAEVHFMPEPAHASRD